ncbi:helicase [Methanococcus voltae]|uniref:DEAD/DEAH box helicase n=1 Tax=Methanococcus voltae TaxID=2188 RepID=UPI001AE6A7B7|nr:DEAD/DEAH box helicase [Methanococcus voltae]MBP2143475.1 helicase [Methanococcus voltae]
MNKELLMNVLSKNGIKSLRPPQEKVLNEGILEKDKNFIISIPTASGKTLIGEMAFINHVLQPLKSQNDRGNNNNNNNNKNEDDNADLGFMPSGKKALFIVPLKALATEKFDEFREKYNKFGLKIGISIGDYDSKENLSRYDIIIMTSEKLDSLMRKKNTTWLNDVSVVIIDEIHLLGDKERGGTLEIVLTKLKMLPIQIIGLSATIGNSEELATWLTAKLVVDTWRPVELKKGLYHPNENKVDYYKIEDYKVIEDKKGKNKECKNLKNYGSSKSEISNLILDCIKNSGSCLVFCSSKRNAVSEAKKNDLTKYLTNDEQEELNIISSEILNVLEKPSKTCEQLSECVKKGVAFHHAGLAMKQRKLVEDAFRKRLIKVICCTPTLSAGLNLPCRRAIIRDTKRFDGTGFSNIPNMEIQQCIGRAGRPGLDPYGEGIIVVKKSSEVGDNLYMLRGKPEEIYSNISNKKTLRIFILGSIFSGEIVSFEELKQFMKNTFYAVQYGDYEKIVEDIKDEVIFLMENGFIKYNFDFDNNSKTNLGINLKTDSEIEKEEEILNYIASSKKELKPNAYSINNISFDENGNLILGNSKGTKTTKGSKSNKNVKRNTKHNYEEYELIEDKSTTFKSTKLGNVTAQQYIDPLSAKNISEGIISIYKGKIDIANAKNISDVEKRILYFICKSTELRPLLRVNKYEYEDLVEEMVAFEFYEYEDYDNICAYKTSKMIMDWINEASETDIFEKYKVEAGILNYKIEQIKWISHATTEIYRALEMSGAFEEIVCNNEGNGKSANKMILKKIISDLQLRIEYGAKSDLVELLGVKNLGRVRARKLFNADIKTIADITTNREFVIKTIGKIGYKVFDELKIPYDDMILEDKDMKILGEGKKPKKIQKTLDNFF